MVSIRVTCAVDVLVDAVGPSAVVMSLMLMLMMPVVLLMIPMMPTKRTVSQFCA